MFCKSNPDAQQEVSTAKSFGIHDNIVKMQDQVLDI